MITKIFCALFPLIIFLILIAIFQFLHVNRLSRLKVTDLALPILALGIYFFSPALSTVNFLPYYLFAMSGLGLIILLVNLFVYREFSRKKFLKLYWRLGFFITFLLYYAMLIISLLH